MKIDEGVFIMNMDWALITSLSFNILFLLIILTQSNKISVLRREQQRRQFTLYQSNDALTSKTVEIIETKGPIPAIKFVREETGMSLVDAKQFVDQIKETE